MGNRRIFFSWEAVPDLFPAAAKRNTADARIGCDPK